MTESPSSGNARSCERPRGAAAVRGKPSATAKAGAFKALEATGAVRVTATAMCHTNDTTPPPSLVLVRPALAAGLLLPTRRRLSIQRSIEHITTLGSGSPFWHSLLLRGNQLEVGGSAAR